MSCKSFARSGTRRWPSAAVAGAARSDFFGVERNGFEAGATASKLHLATAENVTLRERAEHLQARLDHLTRMMFGRRSERLVDPAQNHLFTDGEEEAQADEPVETETLTYERKKPRGGGRKPIDPRLRRVEVRHELPAEELTDPVTGSCFTVDPSQRSWLPIVRRRSHST